MATIQPFRALRFDTQTAGAPETLVCPPYDIISAKDQSEMEKRNPNNIIRVERPLGEDCYRRAADTLNAWMQNGVLRRDDTPAYYIYRVSFLNEGRPDAVHGFFARVRVEDFKDGIVLPHEETLSRDKSDRLNLLRATGANVSPIYGLYDDKERDAETLLRAVMDQAPAEHFTTPDGLTHSLWLLSDPAQMEALTKALSSKVILIADGHHRYETALAYREERMAAPGGLPENDPARYVLMMLVDLGHPGLVVWPTHRLLRELPDYDVQKTISALEAQFEVTEQAFSLPPELRRGRGASVGAADDGTAWMSAFQVKPGTVAFFTGDRLFTVKPRDPKAVAARLPQKSEAYCQLDVSLLHSLILEPLFGIDRENMAGQKNLIYTRSLTEAVEGVVTGAFQCAFLLASTPVASIGAVSSHGERMPQKSTYFYPKLPTGLVVNLLSDER